MSFTKVGDATPSAASLSDARTHPLTHIADVKKHVVSLCATMAILQKQIDALQADLGGFDPAIVRRIEVAGYPPPNLNR